MLDDRKLCDDDKKYWSPLPSVINFVASRIGPDARVLDVGPGPASTLFPPANHVVDLFDNEIPNVQFSQVDFRCDSIPYEDNYFDFVYCRHVLEDLDDPSWLCKEIQRVGKAGYFETPSPLSEMARGIEGTSPQWRGYHHHRHFVYEDGGTLCFLPKSNLIEYMDINDQQIVNLLRSSPYHWNTYFLWEGSFEVKFVSNELLESFWMFLKTGKPRIRQEEATLNAVNRGIASSQSFISTHKLPAL